MKNFMVCLTTLLISVVSVSEEVKPGILRTPDSQFESLPDYDFEPHYVQVGDYRVHYLDEGPGGMAERTKALVSKT